MTSRDKSRKGCCVALFVTMTLVFICVIAGYLYFRYNYPHGYTRAWRTHLYANLDRYAMHHDGRFPSGGTTPERSLTLLYYWSDKNRGILEVLSGPSVPLQRAEESIARTGWLDSESCGWHYVEGLSLNDNRKLALFWEKNGLGAHGRRHCEGSFEVVFVDGTKRRVPSEDWNDFLAEQERLIADKRRKAKDDRRMEKETGVFD